MSLPTKDEIKSRFEQLPLSGDPHLDVHGRMVVTQLLPYKRFDELYPTFVPQFGNDPDSGLREKAWKAFRHLIKTLEGFIEPQDRRHRRDLGNEARYLHQALLQFGEANSNGLTFPPGGPGIPIADLLTIFTRYGFRNISVTPGFHENHVTTYAAGAYRTSLATLYHEHEYSTLNPLHANMLKEQRATRLEPDNVTDQSLTWDPVIVIKQPLPNHVGSPVSWSRFDKLCQILTDEIDRRNKLPPDDVHRKFTENYEPFHKCLNRENKIADGLEIDRKHYVLGCPAIKACALYRMAYSFRIIGWPGGDASEVGIALKTYMKAINNATNVPEDYPSGREAQTLRDMVNLAHIEAGRIPFAEPAPL